MALADYRLCDSCGGKALYDADMYDRWDEQAGDHAVICKTCSETHVCVVMRKADIGLTDSAFQEPAGVGEEARPSPLNREAVLVLLRRHIGISSSWFENKYNAPTPVGFDKAADAILALALGEGE